MRLVVSRRLCLWLRNRALCCTPAAVCAPRAAADAPLIKKRRAGSPPLRRLILATDEGAPTLPYAGYAEEMSGNGHTARFMSRQWVQGSLPALPWLVFSPTPGAAAVSGYGRVKTI